MAKATYGQLWAMWLFAKNDATAAVIGSQTPDNMIFVGQRIGKGTAFRYTVTAATADYKTTTQYTTNVFTASTVNDSNRAIISAPTGGMG